MRGAAQGRRPCDDRAGLGQASRRRQCACGQLAQRPRQIAGAAQIRHYRLAEGNPAVRRPCRHRARQGAPLADVAGADLRAGRPRHGLVRCRPRVVRRRLPPGRYRAQFLRLSSHRRRLHPRVGLPGTRLRGHSRRRRQYRAATRGDRALQAVRLYRHAGFPENPARRRRKDRQGRFLHQARAGLGRGIAGLAARGTGQARRRRAAMLRHRRIGRDRL